VVDHGFVFFFFFRVNIASYLIKQNDEITLKFKEKGKGQKLIKDNLGGSQGRAIPAWLSVDPDHYKGKVLRLPQRDDINYPIKEHLIVELYSR